MCGILFAASTGAPLNPDRFAAALQRQAWRGPDCNAQRTFHDGQVALGHNRLSIVDLRDRANQPMISASGKWAIVFNGEIYNFQRLATRLGVPLRTSSDTEVLLEGLERHGREFIAQLEGMFAFVAYDIERGTWIAARDGMGIKPLYYAYRDDLTAIASESTAIAALMPLTPDTQSLDEWRLIRRPVPPFSFYEEVRELLPGHTLDSSGAIVPFWQLAPAAARFEQSHFEALFRDVVAEHQMGDVERVALLSGGIDSAILSALADIDTTYSVGLPGNHEFAGAAESADVIGVKLEQVRVSEAELEAAWRHLIAIRNEPLSVPNEGLIYLVCKATRASEKVVLTGEGADELCFGYDAIFQWAIDQPQLDMREFLRRYAYAPDEPGPRLKNYLSALSHGKSCVEFVEDWFYFVHLPGLLRRMDSASMAASKEARVPFADRRLAAALYRQPPAVKLDASGSKLPLRALARSLGLHGALARKKIGFSATREPGLDRHTDYRQFRDFVLEAIQW